MNITKMSKQQKGIINSLSNIEKSFRKRLMDLGIYEGAQVILLNVLSSGNLFLIEVDDIEICLRKDDAHRIEVLV